jgi:hypothetical protein
MFAPNLAAEFLDCLLQLKGISMNRYFKVANGMAAGQIANGVACEKQDRARFAGNLA